MKVRMDYTGGPAGEPVFIGWAVPGSPEGASVWRIAKLTYSGSDLTQLDWADGNTNFDNVWTDRAAGSYS